MGVRNEIDVKVQNKYNSLDILAILQYLNLSKCLLYAKMVCIFISYALDVPPRPS